MEIKIENSNTQVQRVMIVSSNKTSVDNAKSVKSLLDAYLYYEFEQPPLNRDHAELGENTSAILDYLEIDLATCTMFGDYKSETNTDLKIAAQVRELAHTLMAMADNGDDIAFDGTDTHNPDANIVVFYEANPDGNPTLELKWYSNDFAYYDSATVIESEMGQKIKGVNTDGVLNLTDVYAVIIEEEDGTNYLITQEYEFKNNEEWAELISEHIQSLATDTLYFSIADYVR